MVLKILLDVHIRVEGGRAEEDSCAKQSGVRFNSSNYIHQQSGLSRQSQCVSC